MSLLLSPWQSIYLLPTNNKKTKTRNHTKLSWTIFFAIFYYQDFLYVLLKSFFRYIFYNCFLLTADFVFLCC